MSNSLTLRCAHTNGLSPQASLNDASDIAVGKVFSAARLSRAAPEHGLTPPPLNAALADAARDIADQLTSLASVQAQHRKRAQSLADAQAVFDLATLRYREGIGNYLQVLSAESPLLEQESLDVDLRARDPAISISQLRALGGGFAARSGPLAAARPSQTMKKLTPYPTTTRGMT